MKKKWFLLTMVFVLLGFASAIAGDLPRLMIMGEDFDTDTVPRGSRVFKRVVGAFSNALINEGFDVYDERARLEDTANRRRRPVEELVDNAKDASADVIVLFAIWPRVIDKGYAKKVSARVEGRLLDVHAGKRLGNFEFTSPKQQRLPANCDRSCLFEVVGKLAKILAGDVGEALKSKLAHYVDGPRGSSTTGSGSSSSSSGMLVEYVLVFDGFNNKLMSAYEEYLEMFSGYSSHRPDPGAMNAATFHTFIYKSRIGAAKLKRNLIKALGKLNMEGQVSVAGRKYTIKKVGMPKDRSRPANDEW